MASSFGDNTDQVISLLVKIPKKRTRVKFVKVARIHSFLPENYALSKDPLLLQNMNSTVRKSEVVSVGSITSSHSLETPTKLGAWR